MKKTEHRKKMIAPVVITVLFLVYLGVYAAVIARTAERDPVLLLFALPLLALALGMVYTLRARINEIRSGEEDDLGNY